MSAWRRMTPWFHPFARLLMEQSCDLWIFPSQDGWSYQFPVPTLCAVHDLMHRYEPGFPEVSDGAFRAREYHYRNMVSWARGVLVDSEVGKGHLHESYGVPYEKIHVLPFIAPKYMHAKPKCDVRVKYGLPEKYLFYPAQFWRHKNHVMLLRAIAGLRDRYPGICLVLVGAPKNGHDDVMSFIARHDLARNVIFPGYVPDEDMSGLYARACALIMPTYFGPTNIPPLEAFVAGCPVAVSGVYGMPEQLGDAAIYFDPSSERQLTAAVERLWADESLCENLRKKGHAHAEKWGARQFNERFREIVESVLYYSSTTC
jgi:glycosyltransferase involved in cell wall biosynthesis